LPAGGGSPEPGGRAAGGRRPRAVPQVRPGLPRPGNGGGRVPPSGSRSPAVHAVHRGRGLARRGRRATSRRGASERPYRAPLARAGAGDLRPPRVGAVTGVCKYFAPPVKYTGRAPTSNQDTRFNTIEPRMTIDE